MNEWTLPAIALAIGMLALIVIPVVTSMLRGRRKKKLLRSELGNLSPEELVGARILGQTKRDRNGLLACAAFLVGMYFFGVLDSGDKWSQEEFIITTSLFIMLLAVIAYYISSKGSIVVTSAGVYNKDVVLGDKWVKWTDVSRVAYDEERGVVIYGYEDRLADADSDADALPGMAIPKNLCNVEYLINMALKMVPKDRWDDRSLLEAQSVIESRAKRP